VGPIAQSVEQRTFNPWVDGSSPSGPTILEQDLTAPPMCVFFVSSLIGVGNKVIALYSHPVGNP